MITHRLKLYLKYLDSGFVLVETDDPEKIISELSNEFFVADMKDIPGNETHLAFIKRVSADYSTVLILNFHTLEEQFCYDGDFGMSLVEDFNMCREAYSELGKILVWFLPPYFVDQMWDKAKDIMDYINKC